MFDDAAHGVRLAWICLLCFVKAQGRAGRVRFRGKKFAENYRLSNEVVDELLARAGKATAVVVDGDSLTVVNWQSYQDPKARNRKTSKHPTAKGVTPKRRQISKRAEKDATQHPAPSTNHPPPPPIEEWAAVEVVLLDLGVAKAMEAAQAARDAGCNAMQVRNLIEFWRSKQPAWGAGALYERLMRYKPDQGFDTLWPPQPAISGYKQLCADEFRDHFKMQRFKDGPHRNAGNPNWVFGTLRDGTKVECKEYKKL